MILKYVAIIMIISILDIYYKENKSPLKYYNGYFE